MKSNVEYAAAFLALVCLISLSGWTPSPGPSPGPDPDPAPDVESPFPADGFWLLLTSESSELAGITLVRNAQSVLDEPGLSSMWLDYDKPIAQEPWKSALAHSRTRAGGQPYYVARHAGKVSEGVMEGTTPQMLESITSVLEALR